jgi:sec-independent protein translocase protein TatB
LFSITHIAIVFVIALLVFGPEKLPEMARMLGRALSDFRKASTDFRRVIEDEFSDLERQARDKEEQARRKALAASNPPSEPATAAETAGGVEGSGAPHSAGAPGTVPRLPAHDLPGEVSPGGDEGRSAAESGCPAAPANGHTS